MDFLHRSYKKELLDGDNIPFDAIERNMLELVTINTWLGRPRHHPRWFEEITER